MADSFINRLNESTSVKAADFTVFDIVDNNTGQYFTKKVSFDTITKAITGNVTTNLENQIAVLQSTINNATSDLDNKLDKRGFVFNPPNNKMTGTLSVNSTLSVFDVANFTNSIDLHNNKILNLADPISALDAVNKRYVDAKYNSISIPSSTNYVAKTGDTMTGSLELSLTPTVSSHAVNKKYVDDLLSTAKFVRLAGDTMTGFLSAHADPVLPTHVATKKYVDDNINTGKFVRLSGDTMTGFLSAHADPLLQGHAATKKYVDDKLSPTLYLPISGGTMTGALSVNTPTLAGHAASKSYVDSKVPSTAYIPLTGGALTGPLSALQPSQPSHVATKKYVDDNSTLGRFLPLSGGTMTGNLVLSGYSETLHSINMTADDKVSLILGAPYNTGTSISNNIEISLGANITGFDITPNNLANNIIITFTLFITQKGTLTSGFKNVTWTTVEPSGTVPISWADGLAGPTITKVTNRTDIVTISKINGKWYGFSSGQNF
jgi:hypothetical protein